MTVIRYERGEIAKLNELDKMLAVIENRFLHPSRLTERQRLQQLREAIKARGRGQAVPMPSLWGSNPGEIYYLEDWTPKNVRRQQAAEAAIESVMSELRALAVEIAQLDATTKARLFGMIRGFLAGQNQDKT